MNPKKYIFIMGHPRSGSTLLQQLLATSPHVSSLPGERAQLFTRQNNIKHFQSFWDKYYRFDFPSIKAYLHTLWNTEKPIFPDKSPPFILHFDKISETFENTYFLCLVRNPYAFTTSVKTRFPDDLSVYYLDNKDLYQVHKALKKSQALIDSLNYKIITPPEKYTFSSFYEHTTNYFSGHHVQLLRRLN